MRPLGAVRNATGFYNMAKQAEVGQVKSHRKVVSFVFDEESFRKTRIATE
jgi:hypothetical protein